MTAEFKILIDARQDECPVPTIRTKEALDAMQTGDVLKLVTSREGTVRNIRTFVASNPCELIDESRTREEFTFLIRKLASNT
jgi:TusA-related sulfurtransferase